MRWDSPEDREKWEDREAVIRKERELARTTEGAKKLREQRRLCDEAKWYKFE